jgi:putative hydrolase of the HAD superfamily
MSRLIPATVRVIFFDAVGTLLHPEPAAPQVYAEVGGRHGSRLDPATIADRFRTAFQRQEDLDRATGWQTSEAREMERWRHIVGEVLADATDPEACFRELFTYFSRADSWRCDTDAGRVLRELAHRGYSLGIASNLDQRLRTIVAGIPDFAPIQFLAISSEIGWRKPAPQFFAALCRMTNLDPGQILLVGDDRMNDYEPARAAGMNALLFEPGNHERVHDRTRLNCLTQLVTGTASLHPEP